MKILLATDGSEYSEGAAKFLTRLNFSSDDEITILHVISWVPFKYDKESYYSSLKQIKQEIGPKILDSTANILKPVRAKIVTKIIDGSPEKYIVNVAVDSDMDMIVMGARGLKGIKSLIIGSVTRSVTLNSPKPVLVIKPQQHEKPGKINILFATDGSDSANETGRILTMIPFHDDTEITIVNVIRTALADIPGKFVPEIGDRIKELIEKTGSLELVESDKVITHAQEYLSKRFKNVQGLTKFGYRAIEILNIAETSKTDLIAVGCRGLKGIKGMMKSLSRNILNHSSCSVLIGKACK
jgi:nucleotide-binding universal stress UspA family protein